MRACVRGAGAVTRAWRRAGVAGGGAGGGAGVAGGGAGGAVGSPLRRLVDEASAFGEAARGEGELEWATQPYTARPDDEPAGAARADPREAVVLLFPGQGAQHVGMGARLLRVPAARDVYEEASQAVGWDVAKVCTEGPKDQLDKHVQVCLTATSLAACAALAEERGDALQRCVAAAGFSLGELAALAWAGAFSLERCIRLAEVRSAAMAACAAARRGGMLAAWFGADARLKEALAAARDHARDENLPDPVCQVANYLYPGCKVVAGDEKALQYLEKEGRQYGIRRLSRVPVAGAFHTPLMAPAAQAVRDALAHCGVRAPRLPVVSNVDARPYRTARDVLSRLPKQVWAPVRWEQTLHGLYARPAGAGFPLTLALGPAAAARATLRHVNARAWDNCVPVPV